MKKFLFSIVLLVTSFHLHGSDLPQDQAKPSNEELAWRATQGLASLASISLLSWKTPQIVTMAYRNTGSILVISALTLVYDSLVSEEYRAAHMIEFANDNLVQPVFYQFGKGLGYSASFWKDSSSTL